LPASFARHDLALVARSRAKLEALAMKSLAKATGAISEILVNNAGFGLAGEAAGLDRPNRSRSSTSIFVRSLK
jgi:short-subunit dehydrogenase